MVSTPPPGHIPWPICVVGVLFTWTGANELGNLLMGFFYGFDDIDLGFLVVLVGYHILRGGKGARGWARFLVWMIIVLLGVAGIAFLVELAMKVESHWVSLNIFAFGIIIFSIFCYCAWGLLEKTTGWWFKQEKSSHRHATQIFAIAAVLGAITGMSDTHANNSSRYFHVTFDPVDEETGAQIDHVSIGYTSTSSSKFPRVINFTAGSTQGVRGETKRNFDVRLNAKGYKEAVVEISPGDDKAVEVEMIPKPKPKQTVTLETLSETDPKGE